MEWKERMEWRERIKWRENNGMKESEGNEGIGGALKEKDGKVREEKTER